jgi:hypothetical protein
LKKDSPILSSIIECSLKIKPLLLLETLTVHAHFQELILLPFLNTLSNLGVKEQKQELHPICDHTHWKTVVFNATRLNTVATIAYD